MKKIFVITALSLLLFLTVSIAADYVAEQREKPKVEPKVEVKSKEKAQSKDTPVKDDSKKETIEKLVPSKSLKERQTKMEAEFKWMEEYGPVKEIPEGIHIWSGKKAKWVIHNFVRPDGWQLSGWSKLTLDKNFNPRRIKIGYISPEIYSEQVIHMHDSSVSREEFRDWNERNSSPVFGISITWRF